MAPKIKQNRRHVGLVLQMGFGIPGPWDIIHLGELPFFQNQFLGEA